MTLSHRHSTAAPTLACLLGHPRHGRRGGRADPRSREHAARRLRQHVEQADAGARALQFVALVCILLALYVARRLNAALSDGQAQQDLHQDRRRRHDGARHRRAPAEVGPPGRGLRHGRRDQCLHRPGAARIPAPHPELDAMLGAHPERSVRSRRRSATPDDGKPQDYEPLRIIAAQAERIEADIEG